MAPKKFDSWYRRVSTSDSSGPTWWYGHGAGRSGGGGWAVEGHLWSSAKRKWGYGGPSKTQAEYVARFEKSFDALVKLKAEGIAAGVYTQTTDVEREISGLMTYDRAVVKIPAKTLAELSERLGPEVNR